MQIEEWKDIPDAPGYRVSSFGNLLGIRFKHFYRPSRDSKGYLFIRIPKFKMSTKIHVLVARLWIGERPTGMQVNHKDGNKLNNHFTNLEYITQKENIKHAIRIGLRPANINLRNNSIFDRAQVQAIRDAINHGHGNQPISKYFKCDHSTISKIRRGIHYPIAL